MAKIPRSEQSQVANPTPLPGSTGGGYTAVGEATQGLGKSIASAGQSIAGALEGAAAEDEQHQMFQAKLAMTEFQGQQAAYQQDYDASISGDGASHVDTRLSGYDQSFQKDIRNRFANAPEKVRQFVELSGSHLRNNALNSSTSTAVRQRGIYYAETTQGVLERQILPQVTGDPKSLEMALQASEGVLGSIPDQRVAGKLREPMAKAIYDQWKAQAGPNAYAIAREYVGGGSPDRRGGAGSFATGQFDGVKGQAGTQSGASAGRDVSDVLTSGKSRRSSYGWTRTNSTWAGLDQFEKAAAMSLLEADGMREEDARNALAAMVNRAQHGGEDLGAHVSGKIYQPTWEAAQERRLASVLKSKQFANLTAWARDRASGRVADPIGGATHFLAKESTMLALERGNPSKYRSWRKWTNFDAKSGSYRGVILRDGSHAFLAPEGKADTGGGPVRVADASGATPDNAIPQPVSVRDYVTNQMAKELPALEKFSAIEAAKLHKKQMEMIEAKALSDLRQTDENSLAERVLEYDPGDPNDPSYPDRKKIFDKLTTEVAQIRTERAKAPAESVANNPEVLQAKANLRPGDPESHQQYARALVDAQKAVGIHNPAIIPKGEAAAYWRAVSTAHPVEFPRKIRELASEVSKLYGPYADQAFMDIVKAGGSLGDDQNAMIWGLLNKVRKDMPPTLFELRKIDNEADILAINRSVMAISGIDPASKYGVEPFSNGSPPLAAIERLLANPELAKDFDERYGEGSAAHVLIGEIPMAQDKPDTVSPEGFAVDRFDFTGEAGKLPASPEAATIEEIQNSFPQFIQMMQEMIGIKPAGAAEAANGAGKFATGQFGGETPLETGAGASPTSTDMNEMQRLWETLPDRDKLNSWAEMLNPDQPGTEQDSHFSKYFSPIRWPYFAAQAMANLPYSAQDIQGALQRATQAIETGQEIAPEDSFLLTTAPLLAGGVGGAGVKGAAMAARAGSRSAAAAAEAAAPKPMPGSQMAERAAGNKAGYEITNRHISRDLPLPEEGVDYAFDKIVQHLTPDEQDMLLDNPVYHTFNYDMGDYFKTATSANGVVIGKTAYFDWLGTSGLQTGSDMAQNANKLGPRQIYAWREAFRQDFPEVEYFMGKRVSGARKQSSLTNPDVDMHQRIRIRSETGDGATAAASEAATPKQDDKQGVTTANNSGTVPDRNKSKRKKKDDK